MSALLALVWSVESWLHQQVEYPTNEVPADAQIFDVFVGASETSAKDKIVGRVTRFPRDLHTLLDVLQSNNALLWLRSFSVVVLHLNTLR